MPDIDFNKPLFGGKELVERKAIDMDVFVPEIDTSKALALFDRHAGKINQLYEAAFAIEVKDDISLAHCTQLGGTIQGGIKELTGMANKIAKPFKDVVSSISTTVRMHKDRLESAKRLLKDKANLYYAAKEIEAKKEADRRRAEAEKVQKELNKQAEELGMEAPQIKLPEVAPQKAAPTRTAKGTGFQKEETVVEVTDENLLPRKYLQPNMVKIRADAKAGIQIPGVTVKKVKDTQFRSAKS